MTSAVIFDFDLTLADSSRAVVECARFALAELGLETVDAEAVRRTIGLTLSNSFEALTGRKDPELAEAFARLFIKRANDVMVSTTSLYPRSAYVLRVLRERGFRTAIVSTKLRYIIQAILAAAELRDSVDLIVGGEDVKRHKPDPEALRYAMARLGANTANSVYVGDHPLDGVAARNVGIRFVRVLTGADHGEAAWTAVDCHATIEDIGGVLDLPGVSSRPTHQGAG